MFLRSKSDNEFEKKTIIIEDQKINITTDTTPDVMSGRAEDASRVYIRKNVLTGAFKR